MLRAVSSIGKETDSMKCYQVPPMVAPDRLREFVQSCDRDLQERMKRVARELAELPALQLLGLTGPSCAGKTTAAKEMTSYLEEHGHRVHVISIDDFYYDKEYLHQRAEEDPNIEIDYDSEDTIDVSLLAQKTEQLLAGRITVLPRFDFEQGIRTVGKTVEPKAGDVFLFEGIQILYPKVRSILSGTSYRSVYIAPQSAIEVGGERFEPNELRRMRRVVRDFRYRATDPAFTFYLWQSVRANEEKNIFPYARFCDLQIDSTMPYEVGMLKPYLEELLPKIPDADPCAEVATEILKKLAGVEAVSADYRLPNSLYKEFI